MLLLVYRGEGIACAGEGFGLDRWPAANEGEEAVAALVAAKGTEAEQETLQPCSARALGVGGATAGTFFCVLHRVFLGRVRKGNPVIRAMNAEVDLRDKLWTLP